MTQRLIFNTLRASKIIKTQKNEYSPQSPIYISLMKRHPAENKDSLTIFVDGSRPKAEKFRLIHKTVKEGNKEGLSQTNSRQAL
jgi:hypothetical protein